MNDDITIKTKEGKIIYGPNSKSVISSNTKNDLIVLAHRTDIHPLILNFSHKNLCPGFTFSEIINKLVLLDGFILDPSYARIKSILRVQQTELIYAVLNTEGKVIRCDLQGSINIQNGLSSKVGLQVKMMAKAQLSFNNVEHSHLSDNTPEPIELYIPPLTQARIFGYTIKEIKPPLIINKLGNIIIDKNIKELQLRIPCDNCKILSNGEEVGVLRREKDFMVWQSPPTFTEATLELGLIKGPIEVYFKGYSIGAEIRVLNEEEGWINNTLISGRYEIRHSPINKPTNIK